MSTTQDTSLDWKFLPGEEIVFDELPETADYYPIQQLSQPLRFTPSLYSGEAAIEQQVKDLMDLLASIEQLVPRGTKRIANTYQIDRHSIMREYPDRLKSALDAIIQRYVEIVFNSTLQQYPKVTLKVDSTLEIYSLPESLQRKHQESVRRAVEYRELHGDPIEGVAQVLDNMIEDEDLWQRILDEPYG